MPTISDLLAARHKPNILGYGMSMCGKTKFISTLRKVYKGPCYIFNFDPVDNLMPLILSPGMGDIEYDQYDTSTGYEDMVKKIVSFRKLASEASRPGGKPFPYELICVENGNIMHKTILETLLRLAGRVDTDGARIQDWGLAANRVKDRLKEILELPCATYVTFHQQIDGTDTVTGKTMGRILIPGKYLPDEIPPMFNLQLHFISKSSADGKTEYKVQCAADNLWPAGDKTGALDPVEDPDYSKMAAKINAKLSTARLVEAAAEKKTGTTVNT